MAYVQAAIMAGSALAGNRAGSKARKGAASSTMAGFILSKNALDRATKEARGLLGAGYGEAGKAYRQSFAEQKRLLGDAYGDAEGYFQNLPQRSQAFRDTQRQDFTDATNKSLAARGLYNSTAGLNKLGEGQRRLSEAFANQDIQDEQLRAQAMANLAIQRGSGLGGLEAQRAGTISGLKLQQAQQQAGLQTSLGSALSGAISGSTQQLAQLGANTPSTFSQVAPFLGQAIGSGKLDSFSNKMDNKIRTGWRNMINPDRPRGFGGE